MKDTSPHQAARIFTMAVSLAAVFGMVGCRDRLSPTEPRPHPTATPTPKPAPIAITGVLEGGPTYGGGSQLTVSICGCTAQSMELLVNDLPPEPLPCEAKRYLPFDSQIRITIRSSVWSVTKTFTVPLDPHVGLQATASCLPAAVRAGGGRP